MPKTRQAIKLGTRQTKNVSHDTAELHWKTAIAKGIPISSAIIRRGDFISAPVSVEAHTERVSASCSRTALERPTEPPDHDYIYFLYVIALALHRS